MKAEIWINRIWGRIWNKRKGPKKVSILAPKTSEKDPTVGADDNQLVSDWGSVRRYWKNISIVHLLHRVHTHMCLQGSILTSFPLSDLSTTRPFPTFFSSTYQASVLILVLSTLQLRTQAVKKTNPKHVSCIKTQLILMKGKEEKKAGCQMEPTQVIKRPIVNLPLSHRSGLT